MSSVTATLLPRARVMRPSINQDNSGEIAVWACDLQYCTLAVAGMIQIDMNSVYIHFIVQPTQTTQRQTTTARIALSNMPAIHARHTCMSSRESRGNDRWASQPTSITKRIPGSACNRLEYTNTAQESRRRSHICKHAPLSFTCVHDACGNPIILSVQPSLRINHSPGTRKSDATSQLIPSLIQYDPVTSVLSNRQCFPR